MLSAKKAKHLSTTFEESNDFFNPRIVKQFEDTAGANSELLTMALAGIHSNVKHGFTNHSARLLDRKSIHVLRSHGYTVERFDEEGDWYYNISWEDAGQNTSEQGQDSIQRR